MFAFSNRDTRALCDFNGHTDRHGSQTPTVGRFRIDGCVNELAGVPCRANLETVRLEPLGLTSQLDLDSDRQFHFENLPPGDYVLSVVGGCNPFGCWEEVPVTITDRDVVVTIDVIPYPSPTPTLTPSPVLGIDLRPSDVIARGEYQSGCRGPLAYLLVCIENSGDMPSGPFAVLVQPGDDRFVIDDLGAQTRLCANRPFTGWEESGYHTFEVAVDVDGVVGEVDEENNSATVRVLRPTIPATCSPTGTPTPHS